MTPAKNARLGLSRRHVVLGGLATAFLLAEGHAGEIIKEIAALKPGEFTWHPERQRTGPVAVIVSLAEQRVHVYRNGIRIAVSTCSTGKPGHETPTGTFVVLQKDKDHVSSTYEGAPMPNMNRLTWSGIALHAGKLPGYPASHGCVRLPFAFSERLYGITHLGTPVIIASDVSDPWEIAHPGLVLDGYSQTAFERAVATLKGASRPNDWTDLRRNPIVSVVMSTADKRAMLIENGEVISEGTLYLARPGKLGSHVFVLSGIDHRTRNLQWMALTHSDEDRARSVSDQSIMASLTAEGAFVERLRKTLHPGAVLVLTDVPLSADRQSGKDFVIMS